MYRFHRNCCFFTIRFATISLTSDSTNPVEIRCPSQSNALPATTSKLRSGRWCRVLTYPSSKPTNSFSTGQEYGTESATVLAFLCPEAADTRSPKDDGDVTLISVQPSQRYPCAPRPRPVAGNMLLNPRGYALLLQACKQRFALSYRQSHGSHRDFLRPLDHAHLAFDGATSNHLNY